MSCTQNEQKRQQVQFITITSDQAGQRIDNFLLTHLKGLPKSRLYRLLRKGEVRVNKKRIAPHYKLNTADEIRIPPVYLKEKAKNIPPSERTAAYLKERILFEDENFLIINKPSGMSVHAGSTVRMGVIEAFRVIYPKLKNLELAHRLDSETSGCLIMAKKKKVLRELHSMLREGKIKKIYRALTKDNWKKDELFVDAPLQKYYGTGGKHIVHVNQAGKSAQSEFKVITNYQHASLMEVNLMTGRTHQIRVHCALMKHPIALDDRYGDTQFNKTMRSKGLTRMFLHAYSVDFTLPSLNQQIRVRAPLDPELSDFLKTLEKSRTP